MTPARSTLTLLLALLATSGAVHAQNVPVGAGSYATSLPSGAVGPQDAQGRSVTPKVAPGFSLPVQTNDFWSSLIYPFYGVPHSNVLAAHPLNFRAVAFGLEIGHTRQHVFVANDYLYPYASQMTVGVEGLNASRATTREYGDWTVTAEWDDGAQTLHATVGHGLPYAFFRMSGGNARIGFAGTPIVWYNQDGTLGVTVGGLHYGIFGPTGAAWTGSSVITSDLAGADYLSVALLPDNRAETLERFRGHAFAFVTGSEVSWTYDEARSAVETTYTYRTEVMEGSESRTLTALYRHQWLDAVTPLLEYRYASPRGEMVLAEGNTFVTRHPFAGVLPALPDRGDYNPGQLRSLVELAARESLGPTNTYDSGKRMARFANLAHIADQIGAVAERDHFLGEVRRQLEDWFTAGGSQQYVYNDTWDVLTGYPSSFGADTQINDHHFHASYAVASAATVARFDSAWAAPDRWGGMVNLLIRDANSWDRNDPLFPFLRSHDPYAGHSWAAGHGDFGDGNNQESSSESLNFASAVVLWGEATGQTEIRDLGAYLHATETAAVEQYWFDVDGAVFPAAYPHEAIGMVWGTKGVHATWFGADPEYVHGINILPLTGGSLYLGRHPDYVRRNYDEIVRERNGQPTLWKDVLWQYLAFGDAREALSLYLADPGYIPFDGESRAHTMHWLYNLRKMGQVDTVVTANTATYGVFRDEAGHRTYVAYNATGTTREVLFSDGVTLTVGPRALASYSTAPGNPDAPVAILQAGTTRGKAPLTVEFVGGNSFDRAGGELTFEWTFGTFGSSAESDPSFTFTETGTHRVVLEVRNTLGFTARDSVDIEVLENGTPFGGTPFVVPGRIQAEDFDEGGEGRAYHDAEAENIGRAYRPTEGVDIEPSSDGGFDVYWITAGEWLEYTFEVQEAGVFEFSPSVASVPGFGSLRMLIDNQPVSPARRVTSTGGWQFWRSMLFPQVPLDAGVHILRIEASSATDPGGWLFSLNHIDVTRVVEVGTEGQDDGPQNRLDEAFPNPFNPATTIGFELATAGPARLELFDLLGRRVAVLADGPLAAGRHEVRLDAAGNGREMTSGVYLVRLSAGGFVAMRRVVLVK